MFKPLTANKKEDALSKTENNPNSPPTNQSLPDIIKTTEERIYIIFDDSGSMSERVRDKTTGVSKSCIELAQEATVDYLKNLKPHVSAVQIEPLNITTGVNLTKNIPLLAAKVKKIDATGGTPLFKAMGKLVDSQSDHKYTRALIFTDGEATDQSYISGGMGWDEEDQPKMIGGRPNLFQELVDLKIPIDLILIGDQDEAHLSANTKQIKEVVDKSGGFFLICKDGNAFKEKMKYFAPQLRYMLPQIASKDSLGER